MNERVPAPWEDKTIWTDGRLPDYRIVRRTYDDGSTEIVPQRQKPPPHYGLAGWYDICPSEFNEFCEDARGRTIPLYPKTLAGAFAALEAAEK